MSECCAACTYTDTNVHTCTSTSTCTCTKIKASRLPHWYPHSSLNGRAETPLYLQHSYTAHACYLPLQCCGGNMDVRVSYSSPYFFNRFNNVAMIMAFAGNGKYAYFNPAGHSRFNDFLQPNPQMKSPSQLNQPNPIDFTLASTFLLSHLHLCTHLYWSH